MTSDDEDTKPAGDSAAGTEGAVAKDGDLFSSAANSRAATHARTHTHTHIHTHSTE